MTTGAGVVTTGTGGVTTCGFVCGGASTTGGADGMTVTGGACDGGADTMSGILAGCGTCRPGNGGLTGVVVGPVAGSANDGVIPPVSAVNEIAVPVANTTTNPRPRQVRSGALIGSRFLSSVKLVAFDHVSNAHQVSRWLRSQHQMRCCSRATVGE